MKKLILSIFAAAMLVSLLPVEAKAEGAPIPVTTITTAVNETAEAQAMLTRLNEIKAMDLKGLSSAERKQLRHEVKDMKKQMRSGEGVYLSVGAIILIAVLLLLLL